MPSVARLSTLKGRDLREDLALTYEVETRELRARRYPRPIYRTHLVYSTLITFLTRGGHHRSHLAREIGAFELLPAEFYGLSGHSFSQIVERSSGDSFDSHTTPSARVSRTCSGSRFARPKHGARLVRPHLAPRTVARAPVGSTSYAQPRKGRHGSYQRHAGRICARSSSSQRSTV